jgi:hypothetical protein
MLKELVSAAGRYFDQPGNNEMILAARWGRKEHVTVQLSNLLYHANVWMWNINSPPLRRLRLTVALDATVTVDHLASFSLHLKAGRPPLLDDII